MKYAEEMGGVFKPESEDAGDKLRFIERQFDWKGEDWHFTLLSDLPAHQIYSFFRHAKLVDGKMWFNGDTKSGCFNFKKVEERFSGYVGRSLGQITVCLARGGTVIDHFET